MKHFVGITKVEAMAIRATGKPGVILKMGEELYYGLITSLKELKRLPETSCALCDGVCRGCQKILAIGEENLPIEDYPFVVEGYETFNTPKRYTWVGECTNYCACASPKKKLSRKEREELTTELYKHLNPDVESYEEVREIIKNLEPA